VAGEPPAVAHEPLDVPYTARRSILEYHGDDARCMDRGTLIPFGYCGSDDCLELACPVCLTGSSCCRSVGETRMLPMLPAGNISPAYRKPHTCWLHHAALTGGMTYSEPASVNLYLVSLLPLAGPRAAWA
jgi:hypothetical protein